MSPEQKRSVRTVESNRLVYYRTRPDQSYWTCHWEETFTPALYDEARAGVLGEFEGMFGRWLPRQGRILEAGCGLGQWVLALRARGWDAEGVEWADETVRAVKQRLPDLPVRPGDVTALDVADGTYAGYISLGVVEHREQGPQPFLTEAFRVLAPGGIAMISVPFFNSVRQWRARKGAYAGAPKGLEFYQYAFMQDEFADLVRQAGFHIEEITSYSPVKGLKDELSWLKWLRFTRWAYRLDRIFRAFGPAYRRFVHPCCHMLMVVARKPAAPADHRIGAETKQACR